MTVPKTAPGPSNIYYETIQENSDDDFQPTVVIRKRKSRESTQNDESQRKKAKGKERARDAILPDVQYNVGSSSNIDPSTTNEVFDTSVVTLDDYNLDSDDDFCETIVRQTTSGESSKFAPRKESKGSSTSTLAIYTAVVAKSAASTVTSAAASIKATTTGTTKTSPVSEASSVAATEINIEVADKRVIAVKTTVKNIWKPAYIEPLQDLVNITNTIVTHTFAFIKYIFVSELMKNIEFDLKSYVNKSFFFFFFFFFFFVEVFLSLTLRRVYDGTKSRKTRLKETTKLYRQLIAKHKGLYCENAGYIPPKLECPANCFKEKSNALQERMTTEEYSTKSIQAAVRKEVFTPCTQVKLTVAKKKEMPNSDILNEKSISEIETLFFMYPTDYRFHKDSIFYDKLKEFICFPIRTMFIPQYMTVDSKIAFKEQRLNKSLHFEGTLEIDGIGVSILKQNTATTRKKKLTEDSPETLKKEDGRRSDNDAQYIKTLTQAELASMNGRCVLIDLGRRDILYCMKETSVVKHEEVLVFTKNDRSKRSRHFRTLRKSIKPSMVESAEALLSKTPSSTVDVVKFVDYIKTRSSVENVLNRYYGNETKSSKDLYFPSSLFGFHVGEKSNLYFGHLLVLNIRGIVSSPDTRTQSQLKLLEKLQVLPFRKLKFSSKIFYDQNNQMLVKRLKKNFGHDAILVIGNWSASNTKYHEPTRNKGLIRMLKKNGFQVFKIDEYKTSSCCPTCESSLKKFKTVANPHPHKRESQNANYVKIITACWPTLNKSKKFHESCGIEIWQLF
ncbi:uncharacterized protein BX663DRAFT_536548 [Cokeromyces recurvatus]|uniref:uncharacterized protein n=1 Tax=Cokeromyces recurvatus TaxID=90255 RepID=UPI002221192E|nr:uncharacterized protein BX663DRAFT_536548 [Cokeromyces recurvatus]KAI7902720.1 hypothetical protein BX663DRAFT_536548 [Cokeromyces recurvatus]